MLKNKDIYTIFDMIEDDPSWNEIPSSPPMMVRGYGKRNLQLIYCLAYAFNKTPKDIYNKIRKGEQIC